MVVLPLTVLFRSFREDWCVIWDLSCYWCRIKQLTETFQSDIELCKANAEEEASAKEAELCSAYEQEKSDLLLKNNQLMEDLEQERAKSEQLEQTMEITCQGYEDKLQRLNEK